MTPILLPNERLKIGIEMEYKNVTTKDTRGDPLNSFVIGPTLAWKPSAQTRLDISPLFGCTDDSPVADVFVAFSWLFGGERAEAEAPVSSRFRYYADAAYARSGKDSGKEMKQVSTSRRAPNGTATANGMLTSGALMHSPTPSSLLILR